MVAFWVVSWCLAERLREFRVLGLVGLTQMAHLRMPYDIQKKIFLCMRLLSFGGSAPALSSSAQDVV